MFARIVVIQLLNQKCIIYISRTITLTVLHFSNFMTKDTSSSPTLILQACYCRLIRLELEISFHQFNFYVNESNRDSLSSLFISHNSILEWAWLFCFHECKFTCKWNVWHRTAAIFYNILHKFVHNQNILF